MNEIMVGGPTGIISLLHSKGHRWQGRLTLKI